MKYLVDPNKIIADFSKSLLIQDNNMDTAMAYLLRDIMYELEIKRVDRTNRLKLVSLFQDIMDVINPTVGNIFSAFDMDFHEAEDGSLVEFMIRFMNELFEIQDEVYREEVIVNF